MANEYELKFLGIDKDALRKTLKQKGYQLKAPERLMKRKTYYFPKSHPNRETHWGRVRDEGDKITASRKWYEGNGPLDINSVHEETRTVSSWQEGEQWVKIFGFTDFIYMENLREEWSNTGVEVCLDSWPGLRTFAEIEADEAAKVEAAARELGFDSAQGVAGGVSVVCEMELGISREEVACLTEITFERPLKSRLAGVP